MLTGTIAYDVVSRWLSPRQSAFRLLGDRDGVLWNRDICSTASVACTPPNRMGSLRCLRGIPRPARLVGSENQRPHPSCWQNHLWYRFPSRPWNYWLMSKRLVSMPFTLFATGFSLGSYAVFLQVCDDWEWQSRLLRRFGQNALLVFALHHLVLRAVKPLVPANSPGWYVILGLLLFVLLNDLIVRYLERRQVVIRL